MPLNRNFKVTDIRRLINEIGDTSYEVSGKTQLGDREIRHLRKGERNALPSTYRLLQLTAWVEKAYPYLEDGEVVPDQIFWDLETIVKSGN